MLSTPVVCRKHSSKSISMFFDFRFWQPNLELFDIWYSKFNIHPIF